MKTLKAFINEANKVTNKGRSEAINKFASAAHEEK